LRDVEGETEENEERGVVHCISVYGGVEGDMKEKGTRCIGRIKSEGWGRGLSSSDKVFLRLQSLNESELGRKSVDLSQQTLGIDYGSECSVECVYGA